MTDGRLEIGTARRANVGPGCEVGCCDVVVVKGARMGRDAIERHDKAYQS